MDFNEKVYELTRKIPKGKVSTYKSIADALGVKAYRAVGNALRRNPNPANTPCFKVVKSSGEIGGYCGPNPRKIKEKIRKLESEGITVEKGKIDLSKYLHKFDS
ncbi:MGMT family protein [Candidatus Woesearchaeota archaeon]|nr:MGMT family protein [Candidatus Woesearchaeota archaeon]